jgi:hypothetical protein
LLLSSLSLSYGDLQLSMLQISCPFSSAEVMPKNLSWSEALWNIS